METWPVAMSLQTAWTALSGQSHVPPLLGAVLVYTLSFLFCLLLQRSLRLILPKALYSYAADFCFTLLVCTYPYSHGTVRSLHGHIGYIVAAVVLMTVSSMVFDGSPSPLCVFKRYLKGTESMVGLAVRVGMQLLSAFLSYRLVAAIWSLEITKEHQMLLKKSVCESDLKVPVVLGFLIEFSAVLYDTWLNNQHLVKSGHLDGFIKNINGAVLVCAGVHLTGMYMHPAMATGMTFNCKDTNTVEHIFVYWIASFFGVYAGAELHSVFHLRSTAADEKKKKKTDGDKIVSGRAKNADKIGDNNNIKKSSNHKGTVERHGDHNDVKQVKKRVNARKD